MWRGEGGPRLTQVLVRYPHTNSRDGVHRNKAVQGAARKPDADQRILDPLALTLDFKFCCLSYYLRSL